MSDISNNNILVTGGAGYIGSHACKALKLAGYNPITFDNLSTGWKQAVQYGPLEEGDLLNIGRLQEVFLKYRPIGVMHFAAASQVGESMKKPALYWRNNLVGSLNLLQTAIDHDCVNFVFSSTCATYGENECTVLDESSVQCPTNAYGASKLAIEHLIRNYAGSYGLRYVIFRYFNVAGADPDGDIGEFHRPETHLIPLIFDAIEGRACALTIFGTDYDTADGTCIRDYVHVCDLVDAHVLGLTRLLRDNVGGVFNLGTGNGFSVREVIDSARHVTNREVPFVEGLRRPGDCTKLVSGSDKAIAELGWEPTRSNMKRMITDAWRWYQGPGFVE